MTVRDELVTGLRDLKVRLERIAFKPNTPQAEVLACGYVCGYLQDVIPRIEDIPDPELLDQALADILGVFGRERVDD